MRYVALVLLTAVTAGCATTETLTVRDADTKQAMTSIEIQPVTMRKAAFWSPVGCPVFHPSVKTDQKGTCVVPIGCLLNVLTPGYRIESVSTDPNGRQVELKKEQDRTSIKPSKSTTLKGRRFGTPSRLPTVGVSGGRGTGSRRWRPSCVWIVPS